MEEMYCDNCDEYMNILPHETHCPHCGNLLSEEDEEEDEDEELEY